MISNLGHDSVIKIKQLTHDNFADKYIFNV